MLLTHMLWNKVECIEPVVKVVLHSLLADIIKRIKEIEKETQDSTTSAVGGLSPSSDNRYKIYIYFYVKLLPTEYAMMDQPSFYARYHPSY